MYLPAQFKEDDVAALHRAIDQIGFGTLVTQSDAGLEANHVPMLIDGAAGPNGTLIGHVSRGNPVWRAARNDTETLAIFLGPNGYITPSWYPTKRETGKVVPTWNYASVHVYGRIEFFEDSERLLGVVRRLTDRHEAGRARPWAVSDAPADYIAGMLKGIVGFALPIARLQGKWKMSQNRVAADRAGVAAGLGNEGSEAAAQLAAAVAARGQD